MAWHEWWQLSQRSKTVIIVAHTNRSAFTNQAGFLDTKPPALLLVYGIFQLSQELIVRFRLAPPCIKLSVWGKCRKEKRHAAHDTLIIFEPWYFLSYIVGTSTYLSLLYCWKGQSPL